jgi:hypothetical protein
MFFHHRRREEDDYGGWRRSGIKSQRDCIAGRESSRLIKIDRIEKVQLLRV